MTAAVGDDEVEGGDDEVEGDDYPFTLIPDWVLLAPISDLAFRIYGLLRAYANKSRGGRTSFPAQTTLARILGFAKTQPISQAVAELEAIGAVTRRKVAYPRGRKTIYRTYLEPHPDSGYRGPRMTAQLSDPDVLAALAAERAHRKPRRRPTDQPDQPDRPASDIAPAPDEPTPASDRTDPPAPAPRPAARRTPGPSKPAPAARFDWWGTIRCPAAETPAGALNEAARTCAPDPEGRSP